MTTKTKNEISIEGKHIGDLTAEELRFAAKKFNINEYSSLSSLRKKIHECILQENLKEFKERYAKRN